MHDWFRVIGYPLEVTRGGLVRNYITGNLLKSSKDSSGYLQVSYNRTTVKHHILLALVFIPRYVENTNVNHIDGNKQNNNLSNLEWTIRSDNQLHAYRVLGAGGSRPGFGKSSNKIKGATKIGNRYQCRIVVNGRRISLGYYETEQEAGMAYNNAAKKYHTNPKLNKL